MGNQKTNCNSVEVYKIERWLKPTSPTSTLTKSRKRPPLKLMKSKCSKSASIFSTPRSKNFSALMTSTRSSAPWVSGPAKTNSRRLSVCTTKRAQASSPPTNSVRSLASWTPLDRRRLGRYHRGNRRGRVRYHGFRRVLPDDDEQLGCSHPLVIWDSLV